MNIREVRHFVLWWNFLISLSVMFFKWQERFESHWLFEYKSEFYVQKQLKMKNYKLKNSLNETSRSIYLNLTEFCSPLPDGTNDACMFEVSGCLSRSNLEVTCLAQRLWGSSFCGWLVVGFFASWFFRSACGSALLLRWRVVKSAHDVRRAESQRKVTLTSADGNLTFIWLQMGAVFRLNESVVGGAVVSGGSLISGEAIFFFFYCVCTRFMLH